ncbi:MAG: methionyl-tRNA formyltransferase [Peptococcaceae bacterium]|jgi:methionyl-tRNA formyltransferase|nr:methionyl-tRNA formyltransferase [Peptococcaceae bacterium]MDH7524292.1 methionyl-tRNA formyltransferase [Peptococcaceae bacterium]
MAEETRIVFMGTPGFAVPSLQALHEAGYNLAGVVTQPDRPSGRGQKIVYSPVKAEAIKLGLNVYQPAKLGEEWFRDELARIKPEIIVVAAFGRILPRELLELPVLGCINVHASLLPAYRGAAPINWAIINGERETGVTTMLMNEGLDRGDILLSEKVVITPDMTSGELHDLLARVGAQLLVKTLALWVKGEIRPQKQREEEASYAPILKPEHEKIDWFKPAGQVHNLVRGLEPWPGAHTGYLGGILKIRETKVWEISGREALPGTVLHIVKGQGFVVQAGEGSVLVTRVQPEGKKAMTASSFINGYRLREGFLFES